MFEVKIDKNKIISITKHTGTPATVFLRNGKEKYFLYDTAT